MLRLSAFAMFAALFAPTGCSKPAEGAAVAKGAEPAAAPVPVRLGKVEIRAMPKLVTLLGNVVADRQSEVAANVSGRVLLAPIERGQKVKVGETLVMVDSKAANLSATAAAAQSELADTQSTQAREDCARAERLFAQGAMGQAEYDRQHTQCKAQQLQANAARAQAGLSSKLAADAIVRAPFSGVIGERYVNAGEYVQPQTRVASMYSIDPVRITISVPEQGVALVRTGVRLSVQVSAWPGRKFPATVEYVSPALRMLQRDLLVEAKAPNPDGALRPGMFATVQVVFGEEQVATVPADAIVSQGDTRRVFLARDGRAFELVVRTGVARDERIVVYEDLAADTQVVRQPPASLRDGMPISAGSEPVHAAATQTGPSQR
ncbi:MAG: efflux RND transporter periplasmic adaptor subunit [Polyangiales bacterium]